MVSAVDDGLDVLRLVVPEPIELEPSRTQEGAKASFTVGLLTPFFCLAMPQQTNYHDRARNRRQFCVQNTAVYLELSRFY